MLVIAALPDVIQHTCRQTSSITTFRHPTASSAALFTTLEKAHVVTSLRHDRAGRDYLRFSPHFYNTEEELDRAVEVLRTAR